MSASDAVSVTSGLRITFSLFGRSVATDEPGLAAPVSGRDLDASSLWGSGICRRDEALRGFGEFAVTVSRVGGEDVVAVCGEVDVFTAPRLGRALDTVPAESERRLVVDLVDLEFIDGSGLRVIAAALERCRAAGGDLVIRSAPAFALRLLRISGLAEALSIEDLASHG